MKKYLLILIIIFQNCYSQDFIKNDSIKFNDKEYQYSHISFGRDNATKYYKIIVTDYDCFKKIEKEIIKCASKFKLEYSEFYVLALKKNTEVNSILRLLFEKIDNERMQQNLSTSIIKSQYDISTKKFNYFTNQPKRKLEELKNYSIFLKLNEVCDFLRI